jgi:phosphatidylinositol alpha-1,6-mannosyltransferase
VRVLFISDKFIPERGGSSVVFGNLYRRLPHEVTVLTRHWEGDAECDRDFPQRVVRVPYSNIPKIRAPLLWRTLASRSAALARDGRFDQIHCGQSIETAPAGTRLATRLGVPSILHTFAEDVTSYIGHPYYGPLLHRGLRDSTVITTISHYTVEQLEKLGVSREKIVLMYPGTEPERLRSRGQEAEIRRRFHLEGKRVIMTLSRLIPRKGQDTVIRALPRILERYPDCVYLIVGVGPEERRLKALVAEMGLGERVVFAGTVPDGELAGFYGACDVFIMANRRLANGDIEGFGLVFLEANLCGKPVIGGRSGGTPDAILEGETGFLIDPESTDEVVDRVLRLLDSPELAARMGETARRRVLSDFTWERSARVLEQAMALAQERFAARSASR